MAQVAGSVTRTAENKVLEILYLWQNYLFREGEAKDLNVPLKQTQSPVNGFVHHEGLRS